MTSIGLVPRDNTKLARRSGLAAVAFVAFAVLVSQPALRWASYEYIGPGAQAFHEARDGRVSDAGWTIDYPENPDSVLAILTYPAWTGQGLPDLQGQQATITLRGDDLNLYGGHATFWVVDEYGRCHHPQPLGMGTTTLDLATDWHRSWTRDKPGPCSLHTVHSYGIAFVGFSQEPTGSLVLEGLTFTN